MAVSDNYNSTYDDDFDLSLTSANAVIMPEGTTSYTVAAGHTGIVARPHTNGILLLFIRCSDGQSEDISVLTGDAVWDINDVYSTLKYSTGGNTNVNLVSQIPINHSGEVDTPGRLLWCGDLKVSGF